MEPLTREIPSPEARFEEAVEIIKTLVANNHSNPQNLKEEPSLKDRQKSKKPAPAKTGDKDYKKIDPASGNEDSESNLEDILSAFVLSHEKGGLSEDSPSNSERDIAVTGRAHESLREYSDHTGSALSEGLNDLPERESLPSFKAFIAMITFLEVMTAVVLAVAVASWLSLNPLAPIIGALVEDLPENSPPKDPKDLDVSRAEKSALAKLREKSLAVEVTTRTASHQSIHSAGGNSELKSRSAWKDPDLPLPDADPKGPAATTSPILSASSPSGIPDPIENSGPANDAPSVQWRGVLASETPPALEAAQVPIMAQDTEETSRHDHAEASARRLAILRDHTHELRLRAARHLQTITGSIRAPLEQFNTPMAPDFSQGAPHGSFTSGSESIHALDEQRLLARAEILLKNSDINGARLILEKGAASGSARAIYMLAQTYDSHALQAKWSVRGLKGDPARAQDLYSRARAGGIRAEENILPR